MKIFTMKKSNKKMIEEVIDALTLELMIEEPGTERYSVLSNQLRTLEEAKSKEDLISKDVLVGVSANILIAVLILNFEKLGVITSKAFNLVKIIK